jgi:tRNA/tmRNA/rRNA uracil-C5-methylase (TrmA/RlmC/RlmD family)
MATTTQETTTAPDLKAVKAKQQAMWASGDFAVIGTTLQIVGETLCEAADVGGGERVLDVAAGNGNATLAAARRFAHVTSTDYVPRCSRAAGGVPKRRVSPSPSRRPTRKTSLIQPRALT